MSQSTPITYTLQNVGAWPALVKSLTFSTPANVSHTANLSNFGSYLASETAFTGPTTKPSTVKTYVSDTSPQTPTYVRHTGTTLVVSDTGHIQAGWIASGNGYLSNQRVVSVTSATWLVMSGSPSTPPSVGQSILFSTSTVELTVNNSSGLAVGDEASGNGYSSGQTITGINGSTLTMSAHPSTTPSPGGSITFYANTPITTLAAGASISWTMYYNNNTSDQTTYYSLITVNSLVNSVELDPFVKNTVTVAAAPPAYDPGGGWDGGGGGGDGAGGGGGCGDGGGDGGGCS
jgi:hypothetical protein